MFPVVPVDACPLCGSPHLEPTSHIIPAFVFDYLKESSGTGFMRAFPAPNLRVQGGVKQHLLCNEHENLLSRSEGEVAQRLFRPYHADTSVAVSYDAWLIHFGASLCWRVLFIFSRLGLDHFNGEQKTLVEQALDRWKDTILGHTTDVGPFELHLVRMDVMKSATGSIWPPNINRYLARAIEMDVAATPSSAFVFVKLCKLIFVGFIQMKYPHEWINTRIDATGVIRPGHCGLPTTFGIFLADHARRMADLQAQISERQKAKILQSAMTDVERSAHSDSFEAMRYDVAMFGRDAFEDEPKE
jgi:hypothetical protein